MMNEFGAFKALRAMTVFFLRYDHLVSWLS